MDEAVSNTFPNSEHPSDVKERVEIHGEDTEVIGSRSPRFLRLFIVNVGR